MPHFTLHYQFESQPRTHRIALNQSELSQAEAIRHLIELHHGDAENSLLMPDADATDAQVMEQAEVLGITEVQVSTQSS